MFGPPAWSLIILGFICSIYAQVNFSTTNFAGYLAEGSGVLESLRPALDATFDFSPSDVFHYRDGPGQYHTGDLTFRYRTAGQSTWSTADTAALRRNVTSSAAASSIQTSNLNFALPHVNPALNVTRKWLEIDGDLALSFTISNSASGSKNIELGSLGMPIEFNNIFTNRTATETTAKCVLVDPYIGLNAGYAQVTRLTGTGPSLVITPLNVESKFEAWRFLNEPEDVPLGYQIQTFEGNYAWEVFSKAWAETEWGYAKPWNPPTSHMLVPGESITVGVRFSVAKGVQNIEGTVSAVGLPVAVGIPGYILPQDLTAKLFLNSTQSVASTTARPAGSLQVAHSGRHGQHWTGYNIKAGSGAFGRARLDIMYADNTTHAVHYWVAHSSPTALSELGTFLTTEQWFANTSDPFDRAPSVITYDRATNDYVLQDNRTWIAGLSDEGGAGSFLAAGMKQSVWPVAAEVSKLETMVRDVVWGTLQVSSGDDKYAVRKSLFYYQPDLVPGYIYDPYFNWTINPGETWNKSAAYLIDRTYDYVHVSALYWGLYRAGRTHPGILTGQDPEWYLLKAYHTVAYAVSNSSDGTPHTGYWGVGLMGETVWGQLLSDLSAENYTNEAKHMESLMLARLQLWVGEADPFGSEMVWDSTGEEGVYYWAHYFHDNTTAQKSINAIRGYMPTVAHWGWNGNARRYWDFLYAGSIQLARIERQIHHYGSGLNSLPILENYRGNADPQTLEAIYDLRIGYGGNQGPLSNIDAGGFGSMAFHSYPDTLRWDVYSGDYGPNALGHILGAATYLVHHPIFEWVSFGGNLQSSHDIVTVEPRDAVRKRVFVVPVSLWVTFDSGMITNYTYNKTSQDVAVSVVGDANGEQLVVMNWEQTVQGPVNMQLASKGLKKHLDGHAVNAPAVVKFKAT